MKGRSIRFRSPEANPSGTVEAQFVCVSPFEG